MGLNASVWEQDPNTLLDTADLDEIRLAHVRIGNIATVEKLREEILSMNMDVPIILDQVLYSGSHSGDSIPAEQVKDLWMELLELKKGSERLERFKTEMWDLVDEALTHRRPISF